MQMDDILFHLRAQYMDGHVDAPRSKSCTGWGKRDRLKAYKPSITPEKMAAYREEFKIQKDELQHISLTEYVTFREENRMQLLNREKESIRTKYFSYPAVQHSDELVDFYTAMPDAWQFFHLSSTLQRLIFRSYIDWEANEKRGFLNHTMLVLMKLRLNMKDEELAMRFGMEPYMVNMTLRTWLPGMYECFYKSYEDSYKLPRVTDDCLYTKVVDIVEVCFEAPEYTKRHRKNQHDPRKAVLSVLNDGLISYASPVVSINRPDEVTIRRSRFADTCFDKDVVAVHPELLRAVSSMGIACRSRMPTDAEKTFKLATERLSEFRILTAIPTEYQTYHEYIFPVCASLINFCLIQYHLED